MRPRRNAAEYVSGVAVEAQRGRASMRPRRNAAEYSSQIGSFSKIL